MRRILIRIMLFVTLLVAAPAKMALALSVEDEVAQVAAQYAATVDMRLNVPEAEQHAYAVRLRSALEDAGWRDLPPQFFLLVDRSPLVQAAFVYWLGAARAWRFVGASPVSTGYAGGYEYFITPLGVFEHTLANPDFRAEGTRNALGVRGYGVRGMRVYDFGWVEGERTWDRRGRSLMRLQLHATDPELLEGRLGRARSKGCIRIPTTLNLLIDRRGLLDADYAQALREGRQLWVLRTDRQPVTQAGRFLVIIDSAREARPAWAPWPPRRQKIPAE